MLGRVRVCGGEEEREGGIGNLANQITFVDEF